MLDLNKIMIVCNGEDKTSSIKEYTFNETIQRYLVSFHTTNTIYKYKESNVSIIDAQPYDLTGKHIFYKGEPLNNLEKVLFFAGNRGGFLRVFEKDGKSFSAPRSCFTVSKSADLSPVGGKIFDYLRALASVTAPDRQNDHENEETKSFLEKSYGQLEFIHPESVLSAYLNHSPVCKREIQQENFIFPFRFNLSQKAALEKALSHSISVIEGPPGTGKTQTILNILANLTSVLGKSVGVVSFNNEAVNNVKDKLIKQRYGFLVADLGRAEKRQAFFQNLPAIEVAEWNHADNILELQKKVKELNRTLTELLADDNRRAQLRQKLAAFQLEQQHFERYYSAQQLEDIKKLPFYARSSSQIAAYLADALLEDKLTPIVKFCHKLRLLFKYKRFFCGKLDADGINGILNLQKRFYVLKINELEKEYNFLSEKLEKYSFKDLQDEHQRISEIIFQKKLFISHSKLKTPNFSIKEYKSDYDAFRRYYPIVLSTNHSLRNSLPQDYLLDYLIVDEASQVDLLSGALALSCCRNLIIVGDMKQLQQIVNKKIKYKIESGDIPQEYDYFNQSLLSSFLCLYGESVPKTTLREHYRCHPKIIQFCNQKYYNGELIPFTDPNSCQAPLMLYKTSKGHHMRTVTHGANGKQGPYNQRELDVIKEEVLQRVEIVSDDIGMATPYRMQVSQASNQLPNHIKCDTIHKFQGRENEVIIMSTVLDSSLRGQQRLDFVDEGCLVNVAVSRAKKQFILVTDEELFQKNGHHIHELLRYIQYNTLDEYIVKSQVVSIFDLLYKDYSEQLEYLKSKMLYASRFKSENIMHTALKEILSEPKYTHYDLADQVLLRNVIRDFGLLEKHEIEFVNNSASIDFTVYNKQDKQCVLAIEVDGFEYHENSPEQLRRDRLKDSILNKYGIPILRFSTNGAGEKYKIKEKLDEIETFFNRKTYS